MILYTLPQLLDYILKVFYCVGIPTSETVMERQGPRAKGRKMSEEIEEGVAAKARFVSLARSLSKEHNWVRKVKQAGKKLRRAGIDVHLYILSYYGGKPVNVPVQVMRSRAGVLAYHERHPECVEAGVVTVVVNNYRSDEHIRGALAQQLVAVRRAGVEFDQLYSELKGRVRGDMPPRTRPKSWYIQRKVADDLRLDLEHVGCEG